MNKKLIFLSALLALLVACKNDSLMVTKAPDSDLKVSLNVAEADQYGPVYFSLISGKDTLMKDTRLGIATDQRDYQLLHLVKVGPCETVKEEYDMLTGKRLHIENESTNRTYSFVNEKGEELDIQFRVFGDGVAFRYIIPRSEGEQVTQEYTAYTIPEGTNRWIASYDPGYERLYPHATDGSNLNPNQENKWGYPALIEPTADKFVLITESDMKRGHAGSLLNNGTDSTVYEIEYAPGAQIITDEDWTSPWRVMIAGDLATIVESTLVTDVATPAANTKLGWIRPAPVSWIYWAYNHGSNDLDIIKQYIDLAAAMKWPYMLIDAEWDEMKGGHKVEEAFEYARQNGVKPMIWYNSSTGWTNGPGPNYRLNDPEKRKEEYKWLRKNGVTGVKIDFFDGDKVETNDYSIDLLEDALDNRLTVTLHGATVPRGWQRTYPNLMTTEGVYGAEWYNNSGYLTDKAAQHNATLPFTRNVIGSMDYTPGTFSDSQHPHITSHGHELALTVLFESAMQHMPDRPSSYLGLPEQVQELLSTLPTVWDDTKLLSGYPGNHAVIARRSGDVWYIAGINGTNEPMTLTADLGRLNLGESLITIYPDGKSQLEFGEITTEPLVANTLEVPTIERGGFVAVISPAESAQQNPFGNPLVPDMIADASIQQIGDWFYCYATTDGYGQHLATSGPPVVWKSRDFVNWEMDGTYFPSAAKEKYWAPSKAIAANGKWYIYPTINHYMYAAVADSPDGPFQLARGEDIFTLPYTSSTLLQTEDPGGIDAEVFIDDDGQAYLYWGRKKAAKLAPDMITVDNEIVEIPIPHDVYTEGPIFFKRNGIYYFLYTIGGDENYQYGYVMSKDSPLGPWYSPEDNIISTTNYETGVFGPGHGCVFNIDGTDDWYFAFLEFGRNSTNRQTYVNKMEFNDDGSIKPIAVDLQGVGVLSNAENSQRLPIQSLYASSVRKPDRIQYFQDPKCRRTEYYAPKFVADASNGSRWMADEKDEKPWIVADLGKNVMVSKSKLFFVRPTAGQSYSLEGSLDGETWESCGGSEEMLMKSPRTDEINKEYRYLRATINSGQPGIWEWVIE